MPRSIFDTEGWVTPARAATSSPDKPRSSRCRRRRRPSSSA